MSTKCLLNAVLRTAAASAMLAAAVTLAAAPAQAGEVVMRNCLHGTAENHSFGYANTYADQNGSDYGQGYGSAYSYTRPDSFWPRGRFGFRRGFVTNSINPNGGGTISGSASGSDTGYRGGSSNGYGTGSSSAYGDDSCVETRRELTNPYLIVVPAPLGEKDTADAAARDRLWQARCKPVIRQDQYGVRRYKYAAAGCEYGKYE